MAAETVNPSSGPQQFAAWKAEIERRLKALEAAVREIRALL